MTTRIIAVRHAHADWIPDEYRHLSTAGMAEAARVPRVLGESAITAIYSSPYSRARQTVEPLAKERHLEILTCDDLRERSLGETVRVTWADASKQSWDDFDLAFPDGESNRTAQARGVKALEQLIQSHLGQCFVIASHGTLLALILQAYDSRYGYDFWKQISLPDVYVLTFPKPSLLSTVERLWTMGSEKMP